MTRLATLTTFVEVVRRGSLSAAAQAMDLPKSNVSRQIEALEKGLGVRLLQRTTRRLSLTDAGRLFYERMSHLTEEIHTLHSEIAELDKKPRGLLRLTAPTEFARIQIAPRLPTFLDQFPEVGVDLAISDRFVDLVKDEIDLAIRFGALRDASLVARRIADDPFILCASPAYLKAAGAPTHPSQLTHHNCLRFVPLGERAGMRGPLDSWRFRSSRSVLDVSIKGNLQSHSVAPLITAALAGLGVLIAPLWSVQHLIARGDMRAVLQDFDVAWSVQKRGIYAVYPSTRYLPLKVRAFMDFFIVDYKRSQSPPLQVR